MQEKIDLSPDEFAEGVRVNSNAQILDVRTEEEFSSGHLPGALNINIMGYDFEEQIEELDRHRPYYVYCRSGGRSSSAVKMMKNKGFDEVYNMVGGILAWNKPLQL